MERKTASAKNKTGRRTARKVRKREKKPPLPLQAN
jgi:hypothetical protein